jgi:membrane-associated phospholipid phosphatase
MTQLGSKVPSLLTPSRARAAALVAVIALSVAGTGWLLDGVREGGDLARLDGPTLSWLVAHREPVATTVMTAVTTVGGEVVLSVVAVLAVLLLAVRRRRVEALLLAVALGGAETISLVLKHVVGRARPPAALVVGPVESTLSFPSGHTIGSATFALALAYLWWRTRPSRARAWLGLSGALALTAVMATSRLYLGDHWLTDVLASTVLALGVVSAVVLLDTWMQRRSRRRLTPPEPESGPAGHRSRPTRVH